MGRKKLDLIMADVFSDITYPCWYVKLENASNRKCAKWCIGVVYNYKKREWSLNLSSLGDVEDEVFWAQHTSLEFAINLIKTFKSEGSIKVKQFKKEE